MQLAYHYALIRGMLETPVLMALVWLAWLLYALKVVRFAEAVLAVTGYAIIVAGVAWYGREKGAAAAVLFYVILLTVSGTFRITYRVAHPASARTRRQTHRRVIPYWLILLRFLWSENKVLLVGIKLFGCAILYFLLRNQNPSDHDIRTALLVYSLAIFGHGPLFYKCRQMDNTQLRCYRAMPVALPRRFTYVAVFCGLLLIPEMLTLGWLTPYPIRVSDALSFVGSGFSLLLLLYCLLSTVLMSTGDFLKLCLVLFGILYGGVLGDFLITLSGFFLFIAAMLFFWIYWRYEAR
jgi:hypothetical protein